MKVWLVGASGMLGGRLSARFGATTHQVVASGRDVDVTRADDVMAFARSGFDCIVNCSGYTDVDAAERESERAFAVNASGPDNLAKAAESLDATLVHVSSDYVFDGRKQTPYVETDPPSGLGVYGKSKLIGERFLLDRFEAGALRRLYLVRTSWMFAVTGENFVRTMVARMLEPAPAPLDVVNDQFGRPTYADDLADTVLSLLGALGGGRPAPPGVYHFANMGQTSWFEYALAIRAALEQAGVSMAGVRVEPVSTSAFSRSAPRPAYSVLSTAKLEATLGTAPRPFEEPLASCVSTLAKVHAEVHRA
jgi:dTDP-4-dehydrorhamnose reductase